MEKALKNTQIAQKFMKFIITLKKFLKTNLKAVNPLI